MKKKYPFARKRTKSKPIPAKDILEKVVIQRGLKGSMNQFQVFTIWDEIVGDTISKIAQPKHFDRGTLTVVVRNSVWIQELQFMKKEIQDRLNRDLENKQLNHEGQIPLDFRPIQNIRFMIGTLPDPSESDLSERTPALYSQPKVEIPPSTAEQIQKETRSVEDEDLRKVLERVLSRSS